MARTSALSWSDVAITSSRFWRQLAVATALVSACATGTTDPPIETSVTPEDSAESTFLRLALDASARFGACVDRYVGAAMVDELIRVRPDASNETRAKFECMAAATRCSQLLGQCLHVDTARPCTPSYAPRCEQHTAVNCVDFGPVGRLVTAQDCALSPDAPNCVVGTQMARCSSVAAPCQRSECDGTTLTWCEYQLATVIACDDLGLVCGEKSSGPGDASCQLEDECQPQCAGDTLTFCPTGGPYDRGTIDCGVLGPHWTCGDGESGAPECVASPGECTHGQARCDGDSLVTCVFGRWIDTDCSEFAGGSCVVNSDGARCEESPESNLEPWCKDECAAVGWSCADAATREECVQGPDCRKRVLESCGDERCFQGECRPPCSGECANESQGRCDGGALSRCVQDGTGCLIWGPAELCPTGSWCDGGQCVACTDECEAGVRFCSNDAVVDCQNIDAEPCLDAVVVESCAAGTVCESGACVPDCDDECTTDGETRCNGGYVSTCRDLNDDGCFEWDEWTACGVGKQCVGTGCACLSACPTSMTAGCFGDQPVTCGPGTGECPVITNISLCAPPLYCVNGTCGAGPVVVLSEIARLGPHAAIELLGPPGLNLTGWALQIESGSPYSLLTLSGNIGVNGYLVVSSAPPPTEFADLAGLPVPISARGRIVLRQGNRVVDSLAFGVDDDGDPISGGEGAAAVSLPTDSVLARNAVGRDTADNDRDFRVFSSHTLGQPNVWPNVPPTPGLICPKYVKLGLAATFDVSGSYDFDDAPVSHLLDYGDGTPPSAVSFSHLYAASGSYTVSLTVADAQGLGATTDCTVLVHDASPPTVTWVTPSEGATLSPGDPIQAQVTAEAAMGRNIDGVTFFVDGKASGGVDKTPPYLRQLKPPVGAVSVTITAMARDQYGEETLSAPRVVAIADTPPIANLNAVAIDALKARLDPTGSDDADGSITIRWDIGSDGTFDTEWGPLQPITWTFPVTGTYSVTLAVMDAAGQVSTAATTIFVYSERVVSSVTADDVWFGTILLHGAVVIPPGTTVTLLPNTVVRTLESTADHLMVLGALTSAGGVTFGVDASAGWAGLAVAGTGEVDLNEATFVGTGVDVTAGELWLTGSTFDGGPGLTLRGGTTALTGVSIAGTGVALSSGALLSMTSSSISGAPAVGLDVRGGRIDVRASSVREGADVGIWLSGPATGFIECSVIADNALEGLRISAEGHTLPSVSVELNDLMGNGRSGYTDVQWEDLPSLTSSGVGLATLPVDTTAPVILASVLYEEPLGQPEQFEGRVRIASGAIGATYETDTRLDGVPMPHMLRLEPPSSGVTLEVDDQSTTGNAAISLQTLALVRRGLAAGSFPAREVVVIAHDGSTYPLRRNWWGRTTDLSALVAGNSPYVDQSGFALWPLNDGPTPKAPGTLASETITGDVTWTGKRVVAGRITVGEGATLTLAAGCELELPIMAPESAAGFGATVEVAAGGTLNLQGTPEAPVRAVRSNHGESSDAVNGSPHAFFRTNPNGVIQASYVECTGAHVAIDLLGGQANLSHVTISDATIAVAIGSVESLWLAHSTIERATSAGVHFTGSPLAVAIQHTTIVDGLGWGVLAGFAGPGPVTLDHVTLARNARGGLLIESGSASLTNADVVENGYGAVVAGTGALSVSASLIGDNELEGIAVLTRLVPAGLAVTGTNFHDNGTAGGTSVIEWGYAGSSTVGGTETISTTLTAPAGESLVGARLTVMTMAPAPVEFSWPDDGAVFWSVAGPFDEWVSLAGTSPAEIQVASADSWLTQLVSFAIPHVAVTQRTAPSARDLVSLSPPGTTLNATGNYWGDPIPAVESLLGGTVDTSGALAAPAGPQP